VPFAPTWARTSRAGDRACRPICGSREPPLSPQPGQFNSASSGGGIYNDGDNTVALINGVVASNKPDNCSPAIAGCVN
jgi:hypothetical protein